MSYEESLRSITIEADASIGLFTGISGTPGAAKPIYGKQYHLLKVTGPNRVGHVTAGTDVAIGVLQNKPQGTGHAATVAIGGVTNVLTGAVVTAGDLIAGDADGKAVTAITDDVTIGVALETSTKADVLIPVLLKQG